MRTVTGNINTIKRDRLKQKIRLLQPCNNRIFQICEMLASVQVKA